MIPLLILSRDKKLINKYIDNLKAGNLFFEVTPSTKEYSIDDIKNIKKETSIFFPSTRFYFFPDFHLSSIPAQNSFLKLLEEPPTNVQFILSTDNKNKLLSTIISRVKIVKLHKNVEAKIISPITKQFIVLILEGLTLPAGSQLNQTSSKIPLKQFKITDKESAQKIFTDLIYFFRKKLGQDRKATVVLNELLRLYGFLESNNLNPQLTLDQALIFIWKKYRMN